MAQATEQCPDPAQFDHAISGRASPQDVQAFASHLEACQACAEKFERSVADDTILEAMREQATLATDVDPAAAAVIDRLLKLPLRSERSVEPATSATQELDKSASSQPKPESYNFLAPPEQSDEIGRLGPYRILKELGAGGMGVVFQAEDLQLKRIVALKVMKPEAAIKSGARERFLREAQAAAKVEHEHIVTIHQVGEANGVPYMAMQWLKGHSLDDFLRQPAPLKPSQAIRVGRQVALGLAAAHEHGLIHRDIKPANIWVENVRGGHIKLLDFGLARPLVDDVHLTQTGAIMGTPAYMAPEQAHGDKVDHRCDLFSLGVVLYRMATGQLPFSGPTPAAILVALAIKNPPTPESLGANLPPSFSELIMQLLEKDPAKRPGSAQEVADRLLRIGQEMTAAATGSADLAKSALNLSQDAVSPQNSLNAHVAVQAGAETSTSGLQRGSPFPRPIMRAPRLLRIATAAGLTAAAVLAIVFFMRTPKGWVRVEINDPSITVALTDGGAVVHGADKSQDIQVAPGLQTLKIKRGDLEFETSKFELKSGDKVTLSVELLPGKIQVTKDDRPLASHDVRSGPNPVAPPADLVSTVPSSRPANPPISPSAISTSPVLKTPAPPPVVAKPAHDTAKLTDINDPAFQKWFKEVLELPTEKQVEAVARKLQKLNPEFDGKIEPKIDGGEIAEMSLIVDHVADIAPLRALTALKSLNCRGSSPGAGRLADLSQLKGLKLISLDCSNTSAADLSPLREIASLEKLTCDNTPVTNLEPLRDSHLTSLSCNGDAISDFNPIMHLKLKNLEVVGTNLSDLRPLAQFPLVTARCQPNCWADLDVLRSIKSLAEINGLPQAQFWQEAAAKRAAFDRWCKRVSALPAQEQVRSVRDKLMEFNPQFDGPMLDQYGGLGGPRIENGVVVGIGVETEHVTDISPLRALVGLRSVWLQGNAAFQLNRWGKLADISPLAGMKLTELYAMFSNIWDLSPLAGMPLEKLYLTDNPVSDLSPLRGLPLAELVLNNTGVIDLKQVADLKLKLLGLGGNQVRDLSPLNNMKLEDLNLYSTPVSDLSPLKGMPLKVLALMHSPISDLSPLSEAKLETLDCMYCPVSDLSPIAGMPLKSLSFDPRYVVKGLDRIRDKKGVERIGCEDNKYYAPKVCWDKYDAGDFGYPTLNDPGFQQWEKHVAALPAEKQVAAVVKKLQELNPGYDGKETHKIDAGAVTEFQFGTYQVKNIAPSRALRKLKKLNCANSAAGGQIRDLSPLADLPLEELFLGCNRITDLSPLRGKRLRQLDVSWNRVTDLSPLAGMPLTTFSCISDPVHDLSPLKGMPLTDVSILGTSVADVSPLKDSPLTNLECAFTPLSDLTPLRGMRLWRLECSHTQIADLSPLRGMKITSLDIESTRVCDLSPLKGMPLEMLRCGDSPVVDLAPLSGLPLKELSCNRAHVADLSPLAGMGLTKLVFTPQWSRKGIETARQIKTLATIAPDWGEEMPAAEFWKRYDAGEFEPARTLQQPEFQQWMKRVAALPAEKQIEAVASKLQELNPGFDGKVRGIYADPKPSVEGGVVTRLGIDSDHVTNLSPVRALTGLKWLDCSASASSLERSAALRDLSPLQGMGLTALNCVCTRVWDLSPLKQLPSLVQFECCASAVSDLTPLAGMPLRAIHLDSSLVRDLSALRGMPLQEITDRYSGVSDLSPLEGMPLQKVYCADSQVTDLSPLKGAPLHWLQFKNTQISDLSPLSGASLYGLDIGGTRVSDLSPIRGAPLKELWVGGTDVADLRPLQGMPLDTLGIDGSSVSDLSPLEGLSLHHLRFSPKRIDHGIGALQQMKSLQNIGVGGPEMPPNEFWKKYDAGEFK